jgi:hypothetical protein
LAASESNFPFGPEIHPNNCNNFLVRTLLLPNWERYSAVFKASGHKNPKRPLKSVKVGLSPRTYTMKTFTSFFKKIHY